MLSFKVNRYREIPIKVPARRNNDPVAVMTASLSFVRNRLIASTPMQRIKYLKKTIPFWQNPGGTCEMPHKSYVENRS